MKPPYAPRSFGQQLLIIAGVAVVYYGAARLGLLLKFHESNASPVWPPTGIAFAAVILLGYRVWPGIMIGAFLANLLTLPQTPDGFVASSAICVGNTLESVVGAFLVSYSVRTDSPLARTRDVLIFVVVALVMCLISATIGPTSLVATGILKKELFGTVWFTWWSGDVAGALILTPAILSWSRPPRRELSGSQVTESVVLFVVLALAVELLFGGYLPAGFMDTMPYSIVTVVLWAATRLGLRATTTAVVLVSAVATLHTLDYSGPFFRLPAGLSKETVMKPDMVLSADDLAKKRELLNQTLSMLQIFVCAVSATALTVSAAVTVLSNSEEELQQNNHALTQQLTKTTSDLAHSDKKLVAEVAEHARAETELKQSKQELEDIQYVAAHDMKEPLRGILNVSNFLTEDHGVKLGDSGLAKLELMRRLSRRLDHLTDWLLHGSSAANADPANARTDLDQLVAEVVDSMRRGLQQRGVELRIPHLLPTIRCNRTQVAEIFRALITNAMTYNDKPGKWIEIGVQDSRSIAADTPVGPRSFAPTFFVRDNGTGISERDLATIFHIFKRPHGVDQYDGGTGVGLAMTKKIIESHGGRIWVESSAQQGTTFYFTLQPA